MNQRVPRRHTGGVRFLRRPRASADSAPPVTPADAGTQWDLEVGKPPLDWATVVGQVFRVRSFDRDGSSIDGNKVRRRQRLGAYGYLHVESPHILDRLATRLPIYHSDDFRLADSAFSEEAIRSLIEHQQIEVLTTYVPERIGRGGIALGGHPLHFILVPFGTLERYYEVASRFTTPEPEKLFGEFKYSGDIEVGRNPNPTID